MIDGSLVRVPKQQLTQSEQEQVAGGTDTGLEAAESPPKGCQGSLDKERCSFALWL